MALPVTNDQLNNVVTSTYEVKRKRVVYDAFFVDNPLFVRLNTKEKVKTMGGSPITFPFIYDKLPGGSYGKGDKFGTAFKEFMTEGRLNWKRYRAEMAADGLDIAVNRGELAVIDWMETQMQVAERTLAEDIGLDLYGDGTGNNSKALDGLRVAIDDTLSYGGITRDTSKQGTAIKASVNTTGGAFSFAMINTQMGKVTFGKRKPDLLLMSQRLWNKGWERSQPSERNVAEDLRKVGFNSWQINGADAVVDPHVTDDGTNGTIYGVNTDFLEFWVLEGNDFRLRGMFEVHDEDTQVGQIINYCNVVVPAPRYNFRIDNVQ
jgi:hypothetical protein